MEFVMFEDVDGMEVYVNPERVIWIRERPNKTTVISCGHDDKFSVRLHPAQALAMLGKLPSEPKARFQSNRDSQA